MQEMTDMEKDSANLLTLIFAYRSGELGHNLLLMLEAISEKWADQNRWCHDMSHHPFDQRPLPARYEEVMKNFHEKMKLVKRSNKTPKST